MRLVAIVLDSPEATLDENVNKLLDYGFANFKRSILVEKEQRFRMLSVGDEVVELISKSDYYYVHPIGVDYVKEVETHIEDIIEPPLTKEQEVGFVRYILMDDTFIDVKIYPKDNVYSNVSMLSNIIRKLKEYKELTFLIAALIILEIIIIIYKLIKGFVYVFSKIKMKFKNG